MIDEKDLKASVTIREDLLTVVAVTLQEVERFGNLRLDEDKIEQITDRVVQRIGLSTPFRAPALPLDQVPMDVLLESLILAGDRAARETAALGRQPAGL